MSYLIANIRIRQKINLDLNLVCHRIASSLLFFLVTTGLVGCVTTPTMQAKTPTAETGTVVLSLGSRGKFGASSHTLKIRAIGRTDEVLAPYLEENLFMSTPRDFDTDGINGAVLILHLLPGSYEIFNFSTFFNGYPSTLTFSSKQDFSIRFSVSKDSTAYLGRYLANRATGKNFLGVMVTTGIYFDVTDQMEHDIRLAAMRFENIRSRPATSFIEAVKAAKAPQVRVN